MKMLTDPGKILHEVDQLIAVDAVDAGDEPCVLGAGQVGVEGPRKPDGPGNRAVREHLAPCRVHEPGDDAQERRLARTVAPQKRHGQTARKRTG